MKAIYIGAGWVLLFLGMIISMTFSDLILDLSLIDLTKRILSGTYERSDLQRLVLFLTGIFFLIIGIAALLYGVFAKERTRFEY